MSEQNGEFIDYDFKPNMENLLRDSLDVKKLVIRGIDLIGRPAPTLNGLRAAYWLGNFTVNDEAPVIAVNFSPKLIPTNEHITGGRWYFGVAYREPYENAADQDVYALEAASSHAHSPVHAARTIEGMFPQRLYRRN